MLKNLQLLINFIGLLIVLVSAGLFWQFSQKSPPGKEGAFFCGVVEPSKSVNWDNDSINIDIGKKVFKNKCATCHNKNMKSDLTGPALGGTFSKYWDSDTLRYLEFVRYSKRMIEDGDSRAVEIWEEWRPNQMDHFPELDLNDIKSLLLYID